MLHQYYVYIITNFQRTVLYTGVTNDLVRRIAEHRSGSGSIFTSKYKCHYLIYYEEFVNINDAIAREKQIKNWKREWKLELIKKQNSLLKDLAENW